MSGKGWKSALSYYKLFSGVEHKYSFCSETYIDREQTGLQIPGHIPRKRNSKELCNLFQNVKALNMKQSCSWQCSFWTILPAFSLWTTKHIEFSAEMFWASAVFQMVVSTCWICSVGIWPFLLVFLEIHHQNFENHPTTLQSCVKLWNRSYTALNEWWVVWRKRNTKSAPKATILFLYQSRYPQMLRLDTYKLFI